MTHLFKLKKDGKTVGHLKFEDRELLYSNNDGTYISPYCISIKKGMVFSFSPPGYGDYYEHDECVYDSIHPFVCKDRNGKDVFAEDPCLLHCFSPPKKVYPKWNQEYLRWELWENGTAVMSAIEDTYKRLVELIEEKE